MPRTHVVAQGECLTTIALRYGFRNYRTVYDHPDNKELRRRRPNPNVILPGDRVIIPDLEQKEVGVATGAAHRFQAHLPRRRIHVVFQDEAGNPAAGVPYHLTGKGIDVEGTTGADGSVRAAVALDVEEVEISVLGLRKRLRIGHLDPAWDADHDAPIISGIQGRLANLGFDVGRVDGILGPRTRRAIRAYARARGMKATADPTREIASRLESDHGS